MQKARWMRSVTFLSAIGIVVGLAFSVAIYEVDETTAGANFCGSCHTMMPFVSSFESHVHGGNNQVGFRALCSDCHLPHNNLPNYLFTHATAGIRDVWIQTFHDTSKIDWADKLKDPGRHVYDSGCMKCHSNLLDKSLSNPRAFLPHRAYFARTTTKTCADCHSNAGHKYLAEYIKK